LNPVSLVTLSLASVLFACSSGSSESAVAPHQDGWSLAEPDGTASDTQEPGDTTDDLGGQRPRTSDVTLADSLPAPEDVVENADNLEEPDGDSAPSPDAGDAGIDDVVTTWTPPGEVGEFAVTEHTVTATGDGASFEAELWVPVSSEPARAVLLLPGFMLSASDFSKTSERLASHGFIVLCPSFGDSFLAAIDHAVLAAHSSAMLHWLTDQGALGAGPIAGRLDDTTFGISGHSRGGKIALLTAIEDDRISAVYTLDPVDTVGGPFDNTPTPQNPSVAPELMPQLLAPVGFFGAGKGGDGFQPCAPQAENHESYYSSASATAIAYHHVDPGAGHMDFTDSGAAGLCAAGEDSKATREAATSTLVAFMRRHLAEQTSYQPYLDGALVDPRLTWEAKQP